MTSAKKRAKHSAISKRKTPKKDRPPEPCPRCVKLAWDGQIRAETVMPLPVGADAPLAEDGSGPCCHDCQAADTINKTILGGRSKAIWGATQQGGQKHPLERMPFYAVRVVVGNERQEQLRLYVSTSGWWPRASFDRASARTRSKTTRRGWPLSASA